MKAMRPLTRGETIAARLAAQRTKDAALAMVANAAEIYRESECASSASALEHIADLIRSNLSTERTVTEL